MFTIGKRLFALSAPCLMALALGGPAFAGEKPFPKAPEPQAQNLQACPEYGRGFFKIAGSDLCTRIGGSVRGETGYSSGGRRSDVDWRTEGTVGLDARDSTTGARAVVRVRGDFTR